MKTKISILLLLAVIVSSCGGGGSQPKVNANVAGTATEKIADADKKLPFERGSYVEETSTMGMDLKKTVYFDRWGEWTAAEDKSELVMGSYVHKTHKLEIVKGRKHWNIDLLENTGTYYELNYDVKGMAEALTAAIGGQMLEGMEMKELGEEDYLGYTCKKTFVKYTQMDMEVTTLSYGNLTMKMNGKMGALDVSSKITSIDLSAPPAAIFEVPDGIDITVEKY